MANPNDYSGVPTYSKHMCSLMRRITALNPPFLRSALAADIGTAQDYIGVDSSGTLYTTNANNTTVRVWNPDLTSAGSITTTGDSQLVVSGTQIFRHYYTGLVGGTINTGYFTRETLSGSLIDTFGSYSSPLVYNLMLGDDEHIAVAGWTGGQPWTLDRYTTDGSLVNSISGSGTHTVYGGGGYGTEIALERNYSASGLYYDIVDSSLSSLGTFTISPTSTVRRCFSVNSGTVAVCAASVSGTGVIACSLRNISGSEICNFNITGISGTDGAFVTSRGCRHIDGGMAFVYYGYDGVDYFQRMTRFSESPISATEWYGYSRTEKVSLGTAPADDALVYTPATKFETVADTLVQMRNAVEAIAPYYWNGTVPYTFATLYAEAMGDRTKYGATGGSGTAWTRSEAQLLSDQKMYDIDIGEIEECVTVLESASLS